MNVSSTFQFTGYSHLSIHTKKKNNILLQVAEYAGFVPQRNPES